MDPNSTYGPGADLAAFELFSGYSEALILYAWISCVIFIIIGVLGNVITIAALVHCKKFQNATAVFIISLHICNLIFCCTVLPVAAVTYSKKRWIFGRAMCSIYPLLKYSLNATAHFTVVAITINRYIMVCHPLLYPRIYNKRNLILSLISTWAVGISLFLPSYFGVWGRFDLGPKGGSCTMVPDKNRSSPKLPLLCFAVLFPYITMTVGYGRIWWIVKKTTNKCSALNAGPMKNNNSPHCLATESGTVCRLLINENNIEEVNEHSSPMASPSGTSSVVQFFNNSLRRPKSIYRKRTPTRKDKKLATMIVAILSSFVLCNLPIIITNIILKDYKPNCLANVIAYLFQLSSAFISPIIYVLMSSEYRYAYTSLFENFIAQVRRK